MQITSLMSYPIYRLLTFGYVTAKDRRFPVTKRLTVERQSFLLNRQAEKLNDFHWTPCLKLQEIKLLKSKDLRICILKTR